MNIVTSTISDKLSDVYPEFENLFGFGPCGAFAALKREQGWGDVAVCIAHIGNTEFTHYVIWNEGIIDLANPLGEPLTYSEIDILNDDEMPAMCEDGDAIAWLKENNC